MTQKDNLDKMSDFYTEIKSSNESSKTNRLPYIDGLLEYDDNTSEQGEEQNIRLKVVVEESFEELYFFPDCSHIQKDSHDERLRIHQVTKVKLEASIRKYKFSKPLRHKKDALIEVFGPLMVQGIIKKMPSHRKFIELYGDEVGNYDSGSYSRLVSDLRACCHRR